VRKKRLLQQARVGGGGVVKKQQPVADTPLAKRMAEEGGPEMLSDLKTLQSHFGARLLHYRDRHGEVGKMPRWLDDTE
jgi:hypothetical protein